MNATNFIQFNNAGISVATYAEIRQSLIGIYKEAYGSDIDLSTGTADGVFIAELAEIISKLCDSVKILWNNLDASTATGVYLDNLCKLSNVYRMPATKSTTSLLVSGPSGQSVPTGTQFIDRSGKIWVSLNNATLPSSGSVSIDVACSEPGPIQAPPGWVYASVENEGWVVSQPDAAHIGLNAESDSALRARRAVTSGLKGATTLGSLKGALVSIAGIRDAAIYNATEPNVGNTPVAADGTVLTQHSVYVIVRKDPDTTVDDAVIGNVIYNKLTPGIPTLAMSSGATASGVAKSYVQTKIGNVPVSPQTIRWKQCIAVHPQIKIEVAPTAGFSTDALEKCGLDLIEWLNQLPISTNLASDELFIEFADRVPTVKGYRICTTTPSSITIATESSYSNPDTYYDYNHIDVTASASTFGRYILTISHQ